MLKVQWGHVCDSGLFWHMHTQIEQFNHIQVHMYRNTSRSLSGCIHYTDISLYLYTRVYREFGELRCSNCVFSGVCAVDHRE